MTTPSVLGVDHDQEGHPVSQEPLRPRSGAGKAPDRAPDGPGAEGGGSRDQLRRAVVATPVGDLTLVASDRGLRAVLWPDHAPGRVVLPQDVPRSDDHPVLAAATAQLTEWLAGHRRDFSLPLDPVGTPFQRRVWAELATIAYGSTVTYAELADRLGDRGKARAVGTAVGRNPLSIVVPCHRVVGADGSLTGFAGGLAAKRALLDLEAGTGTLPL